MLRRIGKWFTTPTTWEDWAALATVVAFVGVMVALKQCS